MNITASHTHDVLRGGAYSQCEGNWDTGLDKIEGAREGHLVTSADFHGTIECNNVMSSHNTKRTTGQTQSHVVNGGDIGIWAPNPVHCRHFGCTMGLTACVHVRIGISTAMKPG